MSAEDVRKDISNKFPCSVRQYRLWLSRLSKTLTNAEDETNGCNRSQVQFWSAPSVPPTARQPAPAGSHEVILCSFGLKQSYVPNTSVV